MDKNNNINSLDAYSRALETALIEHNFLKKEIDITFLEKTLFYGHSKVWYQKEMSKWQGKIKDDCFRGTLQNLFICCKLANVSPNRFLLTDSEANNDGYSKYFSNLTSNKILFNANDFLTLANKMIELMNKADKQLERLFDSEEKIRIPIAYDPASFIMMYVSIEWIRGDQDNCRISLDDRMNGVNRKNKGALNFIFNLFDGLKRGDYYLDKIGSVMSNRVNFEDDFLDALDYTVKYFEDQCIGPRWYTQTSLLELCEIDHSLFSAIFPMISDSDEEENVDTIKSSLDSRIKNSEY